MGILWQCRKGPTLRYLNLKRALCCRQRFGGEVVLCLGTLRVGYRIEVVKTLLGTIESPYLSLHFQRKVVGFITGGF